MNSPSDFQMQPLRYAVLLQFRFAVKLGIKYNCNQLCVSVYNRRNNLWCIRNENCSKITVKYIFACKSFCEQKLLRHQFLWITSMKISNYFWELSSQWALQYSILRFMTLEKSVGALSFTSDHSNDNLIKALFTF